MSEEKYQVLFSDLHEELDGKVHIQKHSSYVYLKIEFVGEYYCELNIPFETFVKVADVFGKSLDFTRGAGFPVEKPRLPGYNTINFNDHLTGEWGLVVVGGFENRMGLTISGERRGDIETFFSISDAERIYEIIEKCM